ncbi:MAG: PA14 domain-containing protein [Tepidisphaeraceae bacterium]
MSTASSAPFILEAFEPRAYYAGGFVASYFPTTTFTGTAVTRTDASFLGKLTPPSGINNKSFSARWTGELNPATTGRHAIYISTEGGVRLWINHRLALNKPAAPGVTTHYKVVTTLPANTPATLQIEYRHDAGKPYVGVAWVAPGGDKEALTGDDVATRAGDLTDQIDHARTFAADQLSATYRTLAVKDGVPIRSEPNKPAWYRQPFTDWTSGTFAGAMWELNSTFAGWDKAATEWTTPLATVEQVGDAFDREWAAYLPYYNATGSTAAKKVLLKSAAVKMTAWNDKIQAFETPGLISHSGNKNANFGVLMDQTMDMAQLLWAGNATGDATYRTRVIAHMKTVAKYMIRADGSVFQRAYFNSKTGEFVVGENYQGYSDTSTWSRAQAWAMNSFATVAAATGDASLLTTARTVSNYFFTHTPSDGVPYWDFQSPNIPKTYRDTSAAAIAAQALAILTPMVPYDRQNLYAAERDRILNSLTTKYLAEGTTLKGVLQHGAANVPKNTGVDASLMFGDYYFLRALNAYTSTA